MADRIIVCTHCRGRIKDREDLVTAPYLLGVAPYHANCYAQALKGCQSLIVGNNPINSVWGNILTVIAVILAVVIFAVRDFPKLPGLLLLLAPAFSLYSYFAFEQHLE